MEFFWEGLSLGFSLIVAIGAQNAFVLKQGIRKEHTFAVAALCSLIDVALIVAGTLGLGSVIASIPLLLRAITFLGALFVAWYGVQAFIRVFRPNAILTDTGGEPLSLKTTVTTLLLLSLLNPHVYLDTVLLVGGISSRHPLPDRYFFTAGACGASILWFFALSYGAGFLAPLFAKKITWKIFDFLIGVIMVVMCVQLVKFGMRGI
jgi:L-lysine exporter family protein LysE/ArgO